MRLHPLVYISIQLVSRTIANTEKVIFLAPTDVHEPAALASLCLPSLTPEQPALYTQLPIYALEGGQVDKRATQDWYLLSQLRAGQRYEVRVCWAATVSALQLPDTNWATKAADDALYCSSRPNSGSTYSPPPKSSRRPSLYLLSPNTLKAGKGGHVLNPTP
jgi:hypothetical protein